MTTEGANAQQAAYWTDIGGPHWVQQQHIFDHMLAPFGRRALEVLAPRAGEQVLDVGCGTGTTTFDLADAVAPGGSVVGVDISPTMVDGARGRAGERADVSFAVADVQVDQLIGAPFDAAFSRFGVMFFADPVAAFTNIASAMRPGGRLTFVCWREESENPWNDLPAQIMRRYTPEPVISLPNAPGPFGFRDRDRVIDILSAAGGATHARDSFSTTVTMGGGAGVDTALQQALGSLVANTLRSQVDEATFAMATAEVRVLLEQHVTGGAVTFPGSVWIVTATR